MAAAAAAAAVAGSSVSNNNYYDAGSPPPPIGYSGPDIPHCAASQSGSPMASQVQSGVDFLRNEMAHSQCANDHADGPRHKSGCSMMYSGDGARLYMCGTFGVSVSCLTAADAVEAIVRSPACSLPLADLSDRYVGGENFVAPGSPLYVTVSKDEGPK